MIRYLKHFVYALSIGILTSCTGQPIVPLDTVQSVDLDRYLGTWYEIALLPNKFQAMCVADTQAHYRKDGDGIAVRNRCRKNDGSVAEIHGVAKVAEGGGNAKLRVSFFRPFYGDYWVLAIDPEYGWVLVGEPRRKFAWVLARKPNLGEATLNLIFDKAAKFGFPKENFRLTPQKRLIE